MGFAIGPEGKDILEGTHAASQVTQLRVHGEGRSWNAQFYKSWLTELTWPDVDRLREGNNVQDYDWHHIDQRCTSAGGTLQLMRRCQHSKHTAELHPRKTSRIIKAKDKIDKRETNKQLFKEVQARWMLKNPEATAKDFFERMRLHVACTNADAADARPPSRQMEKSDGRKTVQPLPDSTV